MIILEDIINCPTLAHIHGITINAATTTSNHVLQAGT